MNDQGGRDYLYDLVKEGVIDKDTLVIGAYGVLSIGHLMVCKWLTEWSVDDVMEMLDANELSPRFNEED
jgi:hypothetical protein